MAHWPGHWQNGQSVCQWSERPGFNPSSSHTKNSKKWYLMLLCLTLSIIRHRSGVKWSNTGNRVAPSHTSQFSSYWKGSLRVAFDYGHQLYFMAQCEPPANISALVYISSKNLYLKNLIWFEKMSMIFGFSIKNCHKISYYSKKTEQASVVKYIILNK